jgi:hypothetical protein
MLRAIGIALVIGALMTSIALASEFDGMSVDQIKAHPGFVASTDSLSSATNAGDKDAPHIYWWIGYIPVGDQRVYFTSYGEPLTCVKWEKTGEWVPEWVVKALDKLVDGGYIVLDPHPAPPAG